MTVLAAAPRPEVTVVTPLREITHGCGCSGRAVVALMHKDDFFPRGALAFFAGMMVFYIAFWLLVAAIMVGRG